MTQLRIKPSLYQFIKMAGVEMESRIINRINSAIGAGDAIAAPSKKFLGKFGHKVFAIGQKLFGHKFYWIWAKFGQI